MKREITRKKLFLDVKIVWHFEKTVMAIIVKHALGHG
jgi:hypothetical protein